jgi:hypothetical protein
MAEIPVRLMGPTRQKLSVSATPKEVGCNNGQGVPGPENRDKALSPIYIKQLPDGKIWKTRI